MPKFKALIMFAVVASLSFALSGCGLIASITGSGPEEIIESSGVIPEWLLLSHRSAEGPGSDLDDALAEEDLEEDDETEQIAAGGDDEDDGIVPDSAETVQEAYDNSTQQTATPTAPSSSGGDSGGSSFEECKPGTAEYALYFANRNPGESCAEFRKRVQEAQAEKEAAEEEADWFEGSPSGWGKTDD